MVVMTATFQFRVPNLDSISLFVPILLPRGLLVNKFWPRERN